MWDNWFYHTTFWIILFINQYPLWYSTSLIIYIIDMRYSPNHKENFHGSLDVVNWGEPFPFLFTLKLSIYALWIQWNLWYNLPLNYRSNGQQILSIVDSTKLPHIGNFLSSNQKWNSRKLKATLYYSSVTVKT